MTCRLRAAWVPVAFLVGCAGGEGEPADPTFPTTVTGVTVSPPEFSFHALEATRTYTAVARDGSGNVVGGVAFTWSSSNESVAEVDTHGVVTARSDGAATIRATTSGVTGSAEVTVEQRVAEVVITPPSLSFSAVGESVQLAAEPRDANGHAVAAAPAPSWSSVDPAVVSVDDSGTAVAQGAGQASVRASVAGFRGYAQVSVEGDGASPPRWVWIDVGLIQGCGLTSLLELYCWGDNDHGQLGVPAGDPAPSPVHVASSVTFDRVLAGGGQSCALTPMGKAYCWGNTFFGEGGYGSTVDENTTPTPVSGGLTFTTLQAGGNHTCGITVENRAYCWGLNNHGQLGDGTATNGLTPQPVTGDRRYRNISLGNSSANNHSCAVTEDGDGYCWGWNGDGELGDGTTEARTTPVRVQIDVDLSQISAGGAHSCGLTPAGEAWCWGNNDGGELGDGTSMDRLAPVEVATDETFVAIVVGDQHTCGLTPGNVAWCWGQNSDGALGTGTNDKHATPVRVTGGYLFAQLAAGPRFTCGLTTTGRVFCWGGNEDNALGIGSSESVNRPTPVLRPDEGGG